MSIRFRLPTKAEFERLSKCWSRFDEEKKGKWFFEEETKEKLFLPCIDDSKFKLGYYWSSTRFDNKSSYHFFFSDAKSDANTCGNNKTTLNVRLVSDAPFGGSIHVAGLYWKPENEEWYYSYDEAMSKFENK